MDYYKSDIISITYEEELKLVRTRWKGFANSDEYRAVLDVYLQVVQEKEVVRWIGDNTNAKAIRPADQEYTALEWAPRFARAGSLKKMAVIVASDIFNKMAVENIIQRSSDTVPFNTHFFDNQEDAFAWVMAG
ncbi:STAS/SEC14 domain-containing protein [Rufibacter ruber]|uniref:STAS/SEC14 domain-containing protein n=1 Tax=Rufibacter ruber TaxID=1783499 RepID=UPI0008374AF8|nr:STAS/SEC14 domain-containing protein [Rufibacter ruber]